MSSCRHQPQRTCLGCKKVLDRDALVRYVVSPEGEILVDYRGKLPGRGAYTCIDRSCIVAAAKNKQFDRAFRGRNRKPAAETLTGALADQIRDRVLNLLGMARKSSGVVTGSNLVLDFLANPGQPALIFLAEDISAGIGEKVKGKAESRDVPTFCLFDKETLGRVMGKGERSVVALREGPLAETISVELSRYKHIAGEN